MELETCLKKAEKYIRQLTVRSERNDIDKVIGGGGFFSWDNERRALPAQPYLFQWSYYNGVVFEGLYDVYEATGDKACYDYVKRYLDALIGSDGNLIFERAGYVNYHGADCYKTAALLARFIGKDERYDKVLSRLYADLTDPSALNDDGNVNANYCDGELGGNYWHSWRGGKPPKRYKLWLDGIYMLQPFLARYAAATGDGEQIEKIISRIEWVCRNFLAPNGLYYHAGNSKTDVCEFFWTRAIGWYCMAIVDVAEALSFSERARKVCAAAIKTAADGLLKFQLEGGLWKNLANLPLTFTNRSETSGTAMICYSLLKGVRLGLLNGGYVQPALSAFCGLCENKLGTGLSDIYFKASASGVNNYENPSDYLINEGKGVGPFIMSYSEAKRIYTS